VDVDADAEMEVEDCADELAEPKELDAGSEDTYQ
jgi:hypothetical protein